MNPSRKKSGSACWHFCAPYELFAPIRSRMSATRTRKPTTRTPPGTSAAGRPEQGTESQATAFSMTEVERYFGRVRALGPVSLSVKSGGTVGLLGLNGAGKTTLLRILAGDLIPSSGEVSIGGFDPMTHPVEARACIGYLPEHPPIYREMNVRPFLRFVGRLRGVAQQLGEPRLRERVDEMVEGTGLHSVAHRMVGHLSHGYRKRLGIAQAILHDPELLILDEPTNGLDPVQVVGIRNLIVDLARSRTVIISSHVLPEVARTCDRVVVVHRGRIAADRPASEFVSGEAWGPGGASFGEASGWTGAADGPGSGLESFMLALATGRWRGDSTGHHAMDINDGH